MIKYLANTNGIRRCAEVDLDNYGQDVWLYSYAIWHEKCNQNFYQDNDKGFRTYMDKFLKIFANFNIHNMTWEKHLDHLHFVLMKLKEINWKFNPGVATLALGLRPRQRGCKVTS